MGRAAKILLQLEALKLVKLMLRVSESWHVWPAGPAMAEHHG